MMSNSLLAAFYDHQRDRDDIYDFSVLQLPNEIAVELRSAFVDVTGHYRRTSRRQAWRSVRSFAGFLAELTKANVSLLERRTLLGDYADYLRARETLRKTDGSWFNFCYHLVSWLSENSAADLWREQIAVRHHFGREQNSERRNELNPDQMSKIVNACKKEIRHWSEAFTVRSAVLTGRTIKDPRLSVEDVTKLRAILRHEAEGRWTQKDMAHVHWRGASGISFRRLAPFRELTIRAALPFYLLILIITAGNPMAIAELPLDCVEDHPTDPKSAILSWSKARASREQSDPFLRAGSFSVSKLVNHLTQMTHPVRHLADHVDRSLLFLVRSGRVARRISTQSWHNALREFRTEHQLPYFTFADMRPAGASLIARDKNDSSDATRKLQHLSAHTTKRYLMDRASNEQRFANLAKFQGQMITAAVATISGKRKHQETLLGMTCQDPLSGIAKGSKKGELCLMFIQCATCPHAIVIYDDPRYVARIVKAKEALESAKEQSVHTADASIRFAAIFQSTLTVIERDILPRVSADILAQAKILSLEFPPIPTVD